MGDSESGGAAGTKIFVKYKGGRTAITYVNMNDTIGAIKAKIAPVLGLSKEEQELHLVKGVTPLEDNKTIEFYGLQAETTLQCREKQKPQH